LHDVWRTEDRLHSDEATTAKLVHLASRDVEIGAVVSHLEASEPGNGSVWATGTASADGSAVLLKLGARKSERAWMLAANAAADLAPRVFGDGELGGVGWLVLEECPLFLDKSNPAHVDAVVTSAARGQVAAAELADIPTMDAGWVERQLLKAHAADIPGDVDRVLAEVEAAWAAVVELCGVVVNHGDVHFDNVVARTVDGPALLIDAMPIKTVWAWDAAYLEVMSEHAGVVRQFESERRRLGARPTERIDLVERVLLGWVAAYWWRIAPWRHDDPAWRACVERWFTAARL
jgi:hypothetical protein